MWMVLGIALPLLCLEAIEGIPRNVIADVPRHSCLLELGVCGITESDADFPIQIEQIKSKTEFTIQLKAPLKSAFTLVYLSKSQELDDSAFLLGSMHSMGQCQFDLPENSGEFSYLLITDKLNNQTLYHDEFISQAP